MHSRGSLAWSDNSLLRAGLACALAALSAGCVVSSNGAPPPASPRSSPCSRTQDDCVDHCRRVTGDQAERGACYTECMREARDCRKAAR